MKKEEKNKGKFNIAISEFNKFWKDELKPGLKLILIVFIIPVFSLVWGFGFIMDDIFLPLLMNEKEFTSFINVYYFQLLMMNIIIPIFIYNPLNPKRYFNSKNEKEYELAYSEILRRYNSGGSMLFFSSLISGFNKFYTLEYEDSITWGDIRCIIIPFCIGFVFFYNSFLKNKTNE